MFSPTTNYLVQQQITLKPCILLKQTKTLTTFYLLQQQIENTGNIYFTPTANNKLIPWPFISRFSLSYKQTNSYPPSPNIGLLANRRYAMTRRTHMAYWNSKNYIVNNNTIFSRHKVPVGKICGFKFTWLKAGPIMSHTLILPFLDPTSIDTDETRAVLFCAI